LLLGFALWLSGCLLVSGERRVTDAQLASGSSSVSFVSAEGEEIRELDTGAAARMVDVVVFVASDQGELRLDLLGPDGAVAFATQSRPGEWLTRSGTVRTDERGRLRFRVVARAARQGEYEVFYQIRS
jgi:uncharacterized protein YfaP (DUF2135 family)